MSLPSVWLHELTWEEVASYLQGRDTIIVPFGTTEQHGPAGPLGLDGYVAIGLAEDAARKAGVLVAPPVWYGDSSHHLGFPGTISLRTETLMQIVYDVVRSLARHGYQVDAFASAEDALAGAEAQPYDAALVDLVMPGRDGADLAETLRRLSPGLPIAILTGYTNSPLIPKPDKSGMAVFTKPVIIQELLEFLKKGRKTSKAA